MNIEMKNFNENPFEIHYKKIQLFSEKLKENGFTPTFSRFTKEDIFRDFEMGMPFPIVEEGINGARIHYDEYENTLKLWFTNGFEDKNNKDRILIQKIWDEIH